MKSLIIAPFLLLLLLISSCTSSNDKVDLKSKDLNGIWTLFKETKGDKTIDYNGEPTASRYEFKENGYFVFYDQITNKKISESGVGSMQDHLKGQFEVKENKILLNHYEQDSLITKIIVVDKISSTELVLVDEKSGKSSYYRK
jgi:hypothetical protein